LPLHGKCGIKAKKTSDFSSKEQARVIYGTEKVQVVLTCENASSRDAVKVMAKSMYAAVVVPAGTNGPPLRTLITTAWKVTLGEQGHESQTADEVIGDMTKLLDKMMLERLQGKHFQWDWAE
jgi:hypothetical protein